MKLYASIVARVLMIGIGLTIISYLGLYSSLGYQDIENSNITIYQDGNMSIKSIENIEIEGKAVKLESEKVYHNVVFEYDGLLTDEIEEFTFHQLENMSYVLNFDETDEVIYLDRTFLYLSRINTVSFIVLMLVFWNIYNIVITTLLIKEEKAVNYNYENKIFKTSVAQKLGIASLNLKYLILTLIGILLIVNYLTYYLIVFALGLSDILVITLSVLFLILMYALLVSYQFKKNNVVIEFSEEELIIKRKGSMVFKDRLENVIYEEQIIRSGNDILFTTYRSLRLKVLSKGNISEGVDLDLTSIGIENFRLLIKNLEEKSEQSFLSEQAKDFSPTNSFSIEMRKVRSDNYTKISIFIALLIVFSLTLSGFMDSDSSLFIVLISLIILCTILLIGLYLKVLKMYIGKFKSSKIEVYEDRLIIDEKMFLVKEILSIQMSDPSEINNRARSLEVVLRNEKLKWILKQSNTYFNNQGASEYQLLYYKLLKTYPYLLNR